MAVRKLGNSEPLEQTSISGQHCLDHAVISGRQNVINREIEPGIHLCHRRVEQSAIWGHPGMAGLPGWSAPMLKHVSVTRGMRSCVSGC